MQKKVIFQLARCLVTTYILQLSNSVRTLLGYFSIIGTADTAHELSFNAFVPF